MDETVGRRGGGNVALTGWVKEEPEDHAMDEHEDGESINPKSPYGEMWCVPTICTEIEFTESLTLRCSSRTEGDYVDNNGYWRFNDMRTAVVESHSSGGW